MEGRISIGCEEIAAVQLLPQIVESFRQKYPRVTFDILTATADLVKEQMDKGLGVLDLLTNDWADIQVSSLDTQTDRNTYGE